MILELSREQAVILKVLVADELRKAPHGYYSELLASILKLIQGIEHAKDKGH